MELTEFRNIIKTNKSMVQLSNISIFSDILYTQLDRLTKISSTHTEEYCLIIILSYYHIPSKNPFCRSDHRIA